MLRILKISGRSLEPDYQNGEFVVIAKFPFFLFPLRPGDTVVFQHPDYGMMIKRVDRVDLTHREAFVIGTHPFSVDSRQFGPVPFRQIQGRVLWHFRRSPPSTKLKTE